MSDAEQVESGFLKEGGRYSIYGNYTQSTDKLVDSKIVDIKKLLKLLKLDSRDVQHVAHGLHATQDCFECDPTKNVLKMY